MQFCLFDKNSCTVQCNAYQNMYYSKTVQRTKYLNVRKNLPSDKLKHICKESRWEDRKYRD